MKDFWNQKFGETPELYGELPNEYFKEKLAILKAGKILLPGEGEGRNAVFAAEHGWEVIALDQSEVAKENALKFASKKNVMIDYKVMDIQDFECCSEFDAIALIYFHLPPNIIKKVHLQLSNCLKKGGTLIIEGFGKMQLEYASGGPKNIEMLYDLNHLKATLPDFEWYEEFDGLLNLAEGKGHAGEAHVIRILGIKK